MVVRPLMSGLIGTTALVLVLAVQSPAYAQVASKDAQIVVDAQTNEVLFEKNAQSSRIPASITKVMTLYLLFDALEKGEITWDDRIVFSRNAANQPPTKLFVGAGNSIPVQTAVEALVLRSANDVATAVAERLGGSETNFAQMMTSKARDLGMSSTTFRNASGLPNAGQRTTAEDLARLAIAIHRDFPDQYHWFSAQQMSWNGQIITGHNHLMGRVSGMDGLKTGYTNASGFNLAATTQRGGRRVVTVVLGGTNRFQRDDRVEALTESAFRELGIGASQFAYNATAYEVNFSDVRDAADAAALFMDLPPRPVTMGGLTTVAMTRSGRRIGFERGAPVFQVADMTRRPSASRVISGRGTQIAQRDENETGPTDEGEVDVARPIVSPTPNPVAVPFRVAVAPSAASATIARRTTPPVVPTSVPVTFPTPVISPAPVPAPGPASGALPSAVPVAPRPTPAAVPLRQMAQLEEPVETASSQSLPASSTPLLGATVEPLEAPQVPLRGSLDAVGAVTTAPTNPEASPPQTQPVQMAELAAPTIAAPVEPPSQPEALPAQAAPEVVQMAQAAPPAQAAPIEPSSVQQSPVQPTQPSADVVQVAEIAPIAPEAPQATQMAELARQDAETLATPSAAATATEELNGSINLAEANPPSTATSNAQATPQSEAAPTSNPSPPQVVPTQMAELVPDAVALAQKRQAEANAREQTRIAEAQAIENTRREAARVQAAAAARVLAERQANERRAERQLAEARAKALKEKQARDLALAERQAVQERAIAAREEERRQAEATRARNARGTAVVQVGAFKDRKDAAAAIARFQRFFPAVAQTEVSTVSRRDGVWYRARFAGVGAAAAGEACRAVLGRGGVCEIVGR